MAQSICVPYEEELKRNPELKDSDIQALREWCSKQPHLPKISDSELVLFLHSNYYLMEPTKSSIDVFYTVRTHVPEFFSSRDPLGNKELRHSINVVTAFPFEKPTNEGYNVFFTKLINSDPSVFVYNDCMKLYNMQLDLWLYKQGTMKGHIIIFDTENVSLGHAARLNPMGLKKFLYYLQEGLPVRLKSMHFINTSSAMDVILNMMKPFMKKELLDMLHLHPTIDTLDKFVPREILPSDLGGKAGSIMDAHKSYMKELEDHRDWFIEDERSARVDESKRPEKPKTAADIFGVEGSFRKIDID